MKIVRDNLMMPRRDWNARGPHVPPWFRRALRRIDPKLALQYMPPSKRPQDDGVDPHVFPRGLLAICRKLRRTRMLQKRWVYGMTGQRRHDRLTRPSMAVLKLVKQGRNAWRQNRLDKLAEDVDRAASRLNAEAHTQDKAYWRHRVIDSCRRHNITKRGLGRIRVLNPGIPKG